MVPVESGMLSRTAANAEVYGNEPYQTILPARATVNVYLFPKLNMKRCTSDAINFAFGRVKLRHGVTRPVIRSAKDQHLYSHNNYGHSYFHDSTTLSSLKRQVTGGVPAVPGAQHYWIVFLRIRATSQKCSN